MSLQNSLERVTILWYNDSTKRKEVETMTIEMLIDKVRETLDYLFDNFTMKEIDEDTVQDVAEDYGLNLCWGATRLCFMHNECDKVVKVINFIETETDYSDIEVEMYNEAGKMGIEDMFLPIRKCATYYYDDNIKWDLYEQPVIEKVYSCLSTRQLNYFISKWEYAREAVHIMSMNKDFEKMLCSCYGEEKLKAFCTLCKKYYSYDFHSNNIGFVNEKPIILDYAGYNE